MRGTRRPKATRPAAPARAGHLDRAVRHGTFYAAASGILGGPSSTPARRGRSATSFGKPKDRLVVAVTMQGDRPIEGDWGVKHLYTLISVEGNVFKWFSSSDQGWAAGQEITIKGTVKGHETY
jgi:hypothetical protein